MLEAAVGRAFVRGIILERDENLPPFDNLLGELEHARMIREATQAMGLAEIQARLARSRSTRLFDIGSSPIPRLPVAAAQTRFRRSAEGKRRISPKQVEQFAQ